MILHIEDDWDPAGIAESGQCFRWRPLTDGGWFVPSSRGCVTLRPLPGGGWEADCTADEWQEIWHPYFDLDENYRAIRQKLGTVPVPFLQEAVRQQQGIRILRQDPWETLISFIISQNRAIPLIARSIETLCSLAGRECPDRRGGVYRAFPSPAAVAALDDCALAECRLGYRAEYVRLAALAVCEGPTDLSAIAAEPTGELIQTLCALRGVGPKVASCVALFGFHRLDVFPVDTWIRRVLDRCWPRDLPLSVLSPYGGVCQQYLFAHARSLPGKL